MFLCVLWGQADSGHGHSWNRFKVTWKTRSTILSRSILWKDGGGGRNIFYKVCLRSHFKRVYVARQEARGWHGNHFSILPNFFLFIPSNYGRTYRAWLYSALIWLCELIFYPGVTEFVFSANSLFVWKWLVRLKSWKEPFKVCINGKLTLLNSCYSKEKTVGLLLCQTYFLYRPHRLVNHLANSYLAIILVLAQDFLKFTQNYVRL